MGSLMILSKRGRLQRHRIAHTLSDVADCAYQG